MKLKETYQLKRRWFIVSFDLPVKYQDRDEYKQETVWASSSIEALKKAQKWYPTGFNFEVKDTGATSLKDKYISGEL